MGVADGQHSVPQMFGPPQIPELSAVGHQDQLSLIEVALPQTLFLEYNVTVLAEEVDTL